MAVSVAELYVRAAATAPPGPDSVNVIVLLCTCLLKVAATVVSREAVVAPEAGVVLVIVGCVVSGVEVMNDQEKELMVLPLRSCAPLMVAV
jgi:hypothetical protein